MASTHIREVVREVLEQAKRCAECNSALVLTRDGEMVVKCKDGQERPIVLCPLLDRLGKEGR